MCFRLQERRDQRLSHQRELPLDIRGCYVPVRHGVIPVKCSNLVFWALFPKDGGSGNRLRMYVFCNTFFSLKVLEGISGRRDFKKVHSWTMSSKHPHLW